MSLKGWVPYTPDRWCCLVHMKGVMLEVWKPYQAVRSQHRPPHRMQLAAAEKMPSCQLEAQ